MIFGREMQVKGTKDATDRRQADRFPLERDVRYKVLSKRSTDEAGGGKTINMSSSGILFTSEHLLVPGKRLELSISWPAQLNNKTALKLVARGRVVRCEDGRAALDLFLQSEALYQRTRHFHKFGRNLNADAVRLVALRGCDQDSAVPTAEVVDKVTWLDIGKLQHLVDNRLRRQDIGCQSLLVLPQVALQRSLSCRGEKAQQQEHGRDSHRSTLMKTYRTAEPVSI